MGSSKCLTSIGNAICSLAFSTGKWLRSCFFFAPLPIASSSTTPPSCSFFSLAILRKFQSTRYPFNHAPCVEMWGQRCLLAKTSKTCMRLGVRGPRRVNQNSNGAVAPRRIYLLLIDISRGNKERVKEREQGKEEERHL